MDRELYQIENKPQQPRPPEMAQAIPLFPGIELSCLHFRGEPFSLRHEPRRCVLLIGYCRSGRLGWKGGDGKIRCLGPGSFWVHGAEPGGEPLLLFPEGEWEGGVLTVDLQEAADNPPDLLRGTDLLEKLLPEKFCREGKLCSFTGDAQAEAIFSGFYEAHSPLELARKKAKALELLLFLAEIPLPEDRRASEYRAEQIHVIREIHDRLLRHMEQRVTIEELSRQYHMNPTTLKAAFKAVYGTSLAAHIKMHRMEQAAKMLRETDRSIADIAQSVGYDSQSKFTSSFKDTFHLLPREYRKRSPASGDTDRQTPPCPFP